DAGSRLAGRGGEGQLDRRRRDDGLHLGGRGQAGGAGGEGRRARLVVLEVEARGPAPRGDRDRGHRVGAPRVRVEPAGGGAGGEAHRDGGGRVRRVVERVAALHGGDRRAGARGDGLGRGEE